MKLSISRETGVWLILVLATAAATYFSVGRQLNGSVAIVVVFLIALAKMRVILFEFMELRHAPLFMRLLADSWLISLFVILVVMFLAPTHTV